MAKKTTLLVKKYREALLKEYPPFLKLLKENGPTDSFKSKWSIDIGFSSGVEHDTNYDFKIIDTKHDAISLTTTQLPDPDEAINKYFYIKLPKDSITKNDIDDFLDSIYDQMKLDKPFQIRVELDELLTFMKARFGGKSRKEALDDAKIAYTNARDKALDRIRLIDKIIAAPEESLTFEAIDSTL